MTREAMDIILNMWTQEPGWSFEGKYWKAAVPQPTEVGLLGHHIKPLQQPHPPIGVAGLSAPSPTLAMAGEHGWIPMSLNLNPGYVKSHWESVEAGAAKAGRTVSRRDWRMVREVFVADTDEEAWRWSVGDMMGRMMREYFLPLLNAFGFLQYLKVDMNIPDEDVNVEYCAEHNWLIGSPATVADKIEKVYAEVGGFGHLLLFCFDYADQPERWRRSMQLLGEEVMPRVAHLQGD
jgi:alkanesulfonate monooxygenase SsuD/methylene tetrahydromethanopterin reductase-like flavin-dependent oxidoreductase (luciferase family)